MVEMQKNLAQSSSHIGANERFPDKLQDKTFHMAIGLWTDKISVLSAGLDFFGRAINQE